MKIYRTLEMIDNVRWDKLVTEIPSGTEWREASKKEKFDFAIKETLKNGAPYFPGKFIQNNKKDFGLYISKYDRYYDRYLSKETNLEDMLFEKTRKSYDEGKGNEFSTGKFYSVASSSRLSAASFSENENGIITPIKKLNINKNLETLSYIGFEENLKIENVGGIAPQMDVMLKTTTNKTYLIEAKCHEIFDNHKSLELKIKYRKTIEKHFKPYLEKLTLPRKIIKEEYFGVQENNSLRLMKSEDFGVMRKTMHFDFKQFLCHLMGIVSYREYNSNEDIYFYYLFFKNEELNKYEDFSKVYQELEDEIMEVYRVFKPIFKKYRIGFGYCYTNHFSTLPSLENKLEKSK